MLFRPRMLRSRPAVLIASLALISGCAARPGPTPAASTDIQLAPAPRSPEAQAKGEAGTSGVVLVWGSAGDGPPRTWHVGEGGAVIREEPGIAVATRRGVWRWETRAKEVETEACELWDGDMREPGEGTATDAELVLREGDERQAVITSPERDEGNVFQHSAVLIGSVGAYLFIEERTYSDHCGAHGSEGAAFTVWDAERGGAVDLLAEVAGVPPLQRAAEAMLEALEEDPEAAWREGEPMQLVKLAPAYDARGSLRLTAQFVRSACYACSDGAWSSYSRSSMVPLPRSPARLAAWTASPPAVQAFLAQTPGVKLGGWSRAGQDE
ncbi:hypothetical protein BE08_16675 [Sorangium cellulosum]|uniref:Secreted protein n=1 Tax=Sorangium cellulosum TaxID=56 RepID=A0A150PQN9_SORCE|nr:hypothetical protein BE08_16675 [Sorangium cellulosum]